MKGSRFGRGAFPGLFLGLMVVAMAGIASGFTFGLYGSFTSAPMAVTSNSATTTSAKGASQVQSSGSSNSSTIRADTVANPYATFFAPASHGGRSVSSLNMLASQPLLLDAFVALPVLAAIAVGVVVYRTSLRKAEKEE